MVHFTNSELVGSRVIRSLTGEDISHVAIETASKLVVHATFTSVTLDDLQKFEEVNTIVRSYRYIGTADTSLWENKAISLEGKNYDKLAFFGAGIRLIMVKLFGWYVPALIHWAKKGSYICTEFVATITNENEINDQITPGELEKQMIAQLVWQRE